MIKVDLEKAKEITHNKRREKRAKEFAPLDVKATIPAEQEKAEKERQAIRLKDASIQIEIDDATDEKELKAIIDREGL